MVFSDGNQSYDSFTASRCYADVALRCFFIGAAIGSVFSSWTVFVGGNFLAAGSAGIYFLSCLSLATVIGFYGLCVRKKIVVEFLTAAVHVFRGYFFGYIMCFSAFFVIAKVSKFILDKIF